MEKKSKRAVTSNHSLTIAVVVKRIAILGPESTGKSVLTKQLADHYQCPWNDEFGREYLLALKRKYTYEDLLFIAQQQWQLTQKTIEQAQAQNRPAAFTDTEMFIMQVWCEVVFNKCHDWILQKANEQQFDLYLLCKPDIAWVKDELREYPDLEMRVILYSMYKNMLQQQTTPWVEIGGNFEERFAIAIKAVDEIIN